jgi:hypothetical protein
VILQPPVGPLDLALGLGGEGIDRFDATLQDHLLPLRIDRIGGALILVDRIAAPDEAEDGMAVDVVRVGIAVAQDEPLHRVDVHPDGLLRHELREEEVPTEVIQRGDQVPLLLGCRRPQVVGGVMLDQFADVAGQHLPIVGLARATGQIEAMPFGPVDDGREGGDLAVVGLQAPLDVAVVVRAERDLRILDRPLVDRELVEDVAFNPSIKTTGWHSSCVLDRERVWMGLVPCEEAKEVGLAEAEHRPDVGAFDFALEIPIQHVPYLGICKPLMQLSHLLEPSFWVLG